MQVVVAPKHLGGSNGIREALAYYTDVGRSSVESCAPVAVGGDVGVLRRGGWSCQQIAVFLGEPVDAELRRSAQVGIVGCKEMAVARKEIMFPYMRGYPCTAHVPVGPHDASVVLAHGVGHGPDVGVVTQAPTSQHTVVGFCRLLSRQAQRRDEVHQRHVHLAEVGHLCQPVVFFEVDVACIVAAPGWQQPFVPQPLQVGRYGLRPRTGDEQIACILEVEFFQVGVRLAKLCIAQQLSVGRQCSYLGRCCPQVEFYAAEVGLIVGNVPCQQVVVGHSHGAFHTLCGKLLIVASFFYRIFVETIETGDVDNQEQCFGAIFEHQPTVGLAADRPVGRHNAH